MILIYVIVISNFSGEFFTEIDVFRDYFQFSFELNKTKEVNFNFQYSVLDLKAAHLVEAKMQWKI